MVHFVKVRYSIKTLYNTWLTVKSTFSQQISFLMTWNCRNLKFKCILNNTITFKEYYKAPPIIPEEAIFLLAKLYLFKELDYVEIFLSNYYIPILDFLDYIDTSSNLLLFFIWTVNFFLGLNILSLSLLLSFFILLC